MTSGDVVRARRLRWLTWTAVGVALPFALSCQYVLREDDNGGGKGSSQAFGDGYAIGRLFAFVFAAFVVGLVVWYVMRKQRRGP